MSFLWSTNRDRVTVLPGMWRTIIFGANLRFARYPVENGPTLQWERVHDRTEDSRVKRHVRNQGPQRQPACLREEATGQFRSLIPNVSLNGEKLGEIHGKVLAIRPTFEIYDSQNQLVAQVKKKIMKLFGEAWWMENSSGQEIAKIKGNIWEHDYYIQDTSGQPFSQIHKKWVSVPDSFPVAMLSPV